MDVLASGGDLSGDAMGLERGHEVSTEGSVRRVGLAVAQPASSAKVAMRT